MEQMQSADVTSKRVCVLSGGWSDEAEISRASAREVARALRAAGFACVEVLDVAEPTFVSDLVAGSYDVAFVAMHGVYGEDGCIQGLLEVLHIPYTFSGVLASAMAMAKDVAKHIYRAADIPVPEGIVLAHGAVVGTDEAAEIVERLGLPLFVKPAQNGSSFGITYVKDASQIPAAVAKASAGGDVLVEQAVTGTEITVPVLGNADPRALPIIEVVMGEGAEFYDEVVKYEPSELHHVIPARLTPEVASRAAELACRAHVALGCKGCSRSDFIVRDDGECVILETNTIPGMTEASLLPDSARHDGIEFPELCRRFVELALEGER